MTPLYIGLVMNILLCLGVFVCTVVYPIRVRAWYWRLGVGAWLTAMLVCYVLYWNAPKYHCH